MTLIRTLTLLLICLLSLPLQADAGMMPMASAKLAMDDATIVGTTMDCISDVCEISDHAAMEHCDSSECGVEAVCCQGLPAAVMPSFIGFVQSGFQGLSEWRLLYRSVDPPAIDHPPRQYYFS